MNSHREALSKQADVGDTSFFGSPRDAPSFGTARVKSSSQNDAAAFLRRVRATYEQTLQLQEVIIPSLDKRWDAACAERDRLKALKTDLSPQIEAAMKRDCEARRASNHHLSNPGSRRLSKCAKKTRLPSSATADRCTNGPNLYQGRSPTTTTLSRHSCLKRSKNRSWRRTSKD